MSAQKVLVIERTLRDRDSVRCEVVANRGFGGTTGSLAPPEANVLRTIGNVMN
jgi:hypothetical protein